MSIYLKLVPLRGIVKLPETGVYLFVTNHSPVINLLSQSTGYTGFHDQMKKTEELVK